MPVTSPNAAELIPALDSLAAQATSPQQLMTTVVTPHTRIPLNQGICGAAASTGKTVVVDDVHSDPRYLACSLETRSEIVVPIFVRGQVAGELDIDSHDPSAFGPGDRRLCEHAAQLVERWLEQHP